MHTKNYIGTVGDFTLDKLVTEKGEQKKRDSCER